MECNLTTTPLVKENAAAPEEGGGLAEGLGAMAINDLP